MKNACARRFVAAAALVAFAIVGSPVRSAELTNGADQAFAVLAKS